MPCRLTGCGQILQHRSLLRAQSKHDGQHPGNELAAFGALRPDARLTGGRLLRYGPPPLPPAKAPEAKEKSEETKEKEEISRLICTGSCLRFLLLNFSGFC